MERAIAKCRFMRISPRKARLAAGLIRGLSVPQATTQLQHCGMKGGRFLKKALDSAVANAESQQELRRENLIVKEVRVDEGPRMKRSKPKNRGGRHPILKRTSHFTVVVGTE